MVMLNNRYKRIAKRSILFHNFFPGEKFVRCVSALLIGVTVMAGMLTDPLTVFAWGDSSGGRCTYTLEEINSGILGDTIVFNSIVDETLAGQGVPVDERFFVGARDASTGNKGADNVWNNGSIAAEDGHEYYVRIVAHNDNPNGMEAVAEDVSTRFSIGRTPDTEQRVDGYITSSNAEPEEYWDSVVFKSSNGCRFHLEYVYGSAFLENNGIGSRENNGGISGTRLSDEIISDGVLIGYDALDGRVPGGYKYNNYVGIRVKVVYDYEFITETKVRHEGTKEWLESVDASVGDYIEFQIHHKNTSVDEVAQNDVIIRDVLPENMEYVTGTVMLWNSLYPEGEPVDLGENLFKGGINVGDYARGGDAYVRFTAKVVDDSLAEGSNTLVNWGQSGVGFISQQGHAAVAIQKAEKRQVQLFLYVTGIIACLIAFGILVHRLRKIK